MKITVGVDGSEWSLRTVTWCAAYAIGLGGEVVAIYALDIPVTTTSGFGFAPIPIPISMPTEAERAALHETIVRDWCGPLARAGVPFRAVIGGRARTRASGYASGRGR